MVAGLQRGKGGKPVIIGRRARRRRALLTVPVSTFFEGTGRAAPLCDTARMKPRYLLLLLGLALAGSLLLGSAGFEIELSEAEVTPAAQSSVRGLAALARVLLGNAS